MHRLQNRKALYPSDPGGGTWIGVNDAGVTFAHINWYSVAERVTSKVISRGEIVTLTLIADNPECPNEILNRALLKRANPFRLIGVFPKRHQIVEWRWNLKRLEHVNHAWAGRLIFTKP